MGRYGLSWIEPSHEGFNSQGVKVAYIIFDSYMYMYLGMPHVARNIHRPNFHGLVTYKHLVKIFSWFGIGKETPAYTPTHTDW